MKKLYIETYGCQMNVADSEVVASVMKMAGYETTDSLDDANAVFLNTCSVRDNAEQKIIHRLEALNALRRKGSDYSRKNVAASALGKSRVARCVNKSLSGRGGNYGVYALQHGYCPVFLRKSFSCGYAVALYLGNCFARHTAEFRRVRRYDNTLFVFL